MEVYGVKIVLQSTKLTHISQFYVRIIFKSLTKKISKSKFIHKHYEQTETPRAVEIDSSSNKKPRKIQIKRIIKFLLQLR